MRERRLGWAWRETRRTLREHLSWHVGLAAVALAIVEVLWLRLHAQWTHELVANALEALGLTAAAVVLIGVMLFIWNLSRAGDRMLIERLQPGPEVAAEEREHVRRLRVWVGMLGDEVANTAARVERFRARRRYWDPRHQEPFELVRLHEAGGLLAIDRRTEPAHRALGNLRREMEAVTHLVLERYREDLGEIGLNPDEVFDEVEMRDGDDLRPLSDALHTAERELHDAMRRLDG